LVEVWAMHLGQMCDGWWGHASGCRCVMVGRSGSHAFGANVWWLLMPCISLLMCDGWLKCEPCIWGKCVMVGWSVSHAFGANVWWLVRPCIGVKMCDGWMKWVPCICSRCVMVVDAMDSEQMGDGWWGHASGCSCVMVGEAMNLGAEVQRLDEVGAMHLGQMCDGW